MSNNNHVCSHDHAKWLDNDLRRMLQNPRKMFSPWIQPGMTILDIGCGPGSFTLNMAEMTGPQGKVIAVDIQEQMLELTRKKLEKAGMLERVKLHRCSGNSLDIDTKADFILTFFMVHEVPDPNRLIDQICSLLSEGGFYFLAEPIFHVSTEQFEKVLARCRSNGLTLIRQYGLISRYAVFQKPL